MQPAYVVGGVVEYFVRRMLGDFLLKPFEDNAPVKVTTAFMPKGKVCGKAVVGHGYANHVAVAGCPSRTVALEPWVLCFEVDGYFFYVARRDG